MIVTQTELPIKKIHVKKKTQISPFNNILLKERIIHEKGKVLSWHASVHKNIRGGYT